VTAEHGVPRRRPPRPVSDAPVDALLARVEDLAKAWLLALLDQCELEDAPAILGARLVRDGPRLCGAIVRALADDLDLRRLEPGGVLERLAASAGELAGASQAEPSARAVDALRAVIWSAAREELTRPEADEVEALGERLALVTETVRAAVLRRFGEMPAGVGLGIAEGGSGAAVSGVEEGSFAAPRVAADRLAAVAVDRPVAVAVERPAAAAVDRPAAVAVERPAAVAVDSLWRGALEDEVQRAQRSGAHLALLLAELSDADGEPASEPVHVASETFGRFAQAVRSVLRRDDILACETETRAWVIARTTGRAGARALGTRIAHAVQMAEPWRRAPLTVGIGIAILGEDAHDAVGLIEAAADWTFAAESGGAAPSDGPGEPA
jgi:GGDEF domain-containing protein